MNVQGNSYTFIYASLMVVVVAALLSFVAINLQPLQKKNIRIEKKRDILSSIGVSSTAENADDLYEQYIKDESVIDIKGKAQEGVEAFNVNLKKELVKPPAERNLPLFKCEKNDSNFVVVPVRGKGLWGPIWGYIAMQENVEKIELEPDVVVETDSITGDTIRQETKQNFKEVKTYSTIYGAVFDHKGETPGLGAEINQYWFEEPFSGKKIFDKNGNFISIEVVKGGAPPDSRNAVDAISGGTITSKGVEAMLDTCLYNYTTYFKNKK